jgi:hypothetical protein
MTPDDLYYDDGNYMSLRQIMHTEFSYRLFGADATWS